MGRHLKRYLMPEGWPVKKKGNIFVVKPRAGPHKIENSLPLTIILRDVLKLVKTSKEANRVIKAGGILVDKKPRKDPKYPVGLMDVVEIPVNKKQYRVTVDKNGLSLVEISEKETTEKVCRINNKKTIKGGQSQINLHDGRNILTENKEYKPGDSVKITLPEQAVQEHLKLSVGSHVLIIDGKNRGLEGKLVSMDKRKLMTDKNTVTIDIKGKKVETLQDYIIVTGQEKTGKK